MGFRKSLIVALAIASLTPAAHAAPAKKFPPRDECLSVDGYFELRQKFEDAVKRRDSKAFLAMVSPTLSWSFGGGNGKAEFVKEWKLDTGKASPIWAELDKIVRLGCYSNGPSEVVMPHYFGQDISMEDVGGGQALVLGTGVNLRAQPNTSSASLRKLDWEVVVTTGASPDEKWTKVKAADGKTGYIRNDYLREYLDYRIGFSRTGDTWVVHFFIAGD